MALIRIIRSGCSLKMAIIPLLLLASSGCVLAQNRISGRIVDASNGEGLPSTNVFFAGTSIGTTTNKDGWFSITGFGSGKYDFTVSFVGFAMYRQSYTFTGKEQVRLLIKLTPDVQQLDAVVVGVKDSERKANYVTFKKLFLGEGKLARQCEIINGDDVYLYRDPKEGILVAHCGKPLIIENRALGYRIQYFLILFEYQFGNGFYGSGRLDVYGTPHFEEMKAKDDEERKDWEKKREEAYAGSVIHFMRSMVKDKLIEENFTVSRVIRKFNPERPPQEYLDRKVDSLRALKEKVGSEKNMDLIMEELNRYRSLKALPISFDSLVSEALHGRELLNPDTLNQINYKGRLVIRFGDKKIRNKVSMSDDTIVDFLTKFKVYENGYFDNLGSLFFEGRWASTEKIPALLPLEYNSKAKLE